MCIRDRLTIKYKKPVKINVLQEEYMVDKDTIQQISQKIKNIIADSPISDIEENINALLKGMFTKMDLITREEFDVQTGVLKKTREKLEKLEEQLSKIEKSIK